MSAYDCDTCGGRSSYQAVCCGRPMRPARDPFDAMLALVDFRSGVAGITAETTESTIAAGEALVAVVGTRWRHRVVSTLQGAGAIAAGITASIAVTAGLTLGIAACTPAPPQPQPAPTVFCPSGQHVAGVDSTGFPECAR